MQDAALRKMRRRLSSGAMPRRASMEHATLHTIGERSHSSINWDDCDNGDDYHQELEGRHMRCRRSSVSFSDTESVREYSPEPAATVAERFYSPEDIGEFRREYQQERQRMARRNSTGSAPVPVRKQGIASLAVSLNLGAPAATGGGVTSLASVAYPYISPYARTSPSTSNHYFSSDSVGIPTTSGPFHASDTIKEEDAGERKGPIMTFSSPVGHHLKKLADSSSRSHPRHQRRHSVGQIQAAGFTTPIDQIRTVMAGGTAGKEGQPALSSQHDLAAAQFVSVSCPMPRRPSTAGIA